MDAVSLNTGSYANAVIQKARTTQGTAVLALLEVMRKSEAVASAPLTGLLTATGVDVYA